MTGNPFFELSAPQPGRTTVSRVASGAPMAAEPVTAGATDCAAAHVIDAVGAIDDSRVKQHAAGFVAELIAVSPRFRQAVEGIEQQAAALREIDRHMPELSAARGDGEWALSICSLGGQLDDLVAMAEPSGFADPGELLDPDGSMEPLIGHLLRLAEVAAGRGDRRFTPEVVSWLRRGAAREAVGRRFLLRSHARRARWPWNATGPMGRAGDADHPMAFGRLLPIERRFRATLVRVRTALEGPRADCRAAKHRLEALATGPTPLPPRIEGLLRAATVWIRLPATADPGSGPGPRKRDGHALARALDQAEALLVARGGLVREDAEGLAALRRKLPVVAFPSGAPWGGDG